ncbi:rRNA processing/ribosome biogenesis-domain-containing protein [Russula aff. rugulosa BPL654]|nr:rRNA processing/ribosome biogenesis-domain-containing protein [Russula aff. rugulosa BPL654]
MSTSDSVHPLKTLLHIQLASDNAAVLNLPHVIRFLSAQHLQPSPHLQKWMTRINTLIHSKEPGACWAGLTIACQTSLLSRQVMLESAKSWVSVALPLFSVLPLPTLKTATRLLTHIFSVARDTPEFQRQIASPNVPKFSLALIAIAEDHPSRELMLLAIDALSVLLPLYPTLYKALHGRLTAFCLRQINCSAGQPMDGPVVQATSRLYAVLSVTGGKVGAASLWRKSVDEILSIGWASLHALRTTFPNDANMAPPRQAQPNLEDAIVTVPLNLDRLRCVVLALSDLLSSPTARAVQLPLGALVSFSQELLSCTCDDDKDDRRAEPSVRAMEEAALPEICVLGSDLLSRLAACAERHLTPHAGRFTNIILYHLELVPPPNRRVEFLRALVSLLTNVHTIHFPLVLNRIAKVLLSTLSVLLPTQSDIRTGRVSDTNGKGRKGRKRAHDYEGDEIFEITTNAISSNPIHDAMILTTLDALRLVIPNPCLPSATYSLISRVLLGINVWLPSLDPARLSGDLSLHAQILRRVQGACMDISADTRCAMSKNLNLIMYGLLEPTDNPDIPSTATLRELDRLIHPRVPSLVRASPHIELLSLSRTEESVEEQEIRESLHLNVVLPTGETRGAINPSSITITTPCPQTVHPNIETLSNVDEPKTPAPVPLQQAPLRPQAPASFDLEGAHGPSHMLNVSPAAQIPSIGRLNSNDTLYLTQADEISSASMGGVVTAIEGPHLGTTLEATSVVQEEEDNDDEEMPSIDMGSDSD